jgi:hypothetical protein
VGRAIDARQSECHCGDSPRRGGKGGPTLPHSLVVLGDRFQARLAGRGGHALKRLSVTAVVCALALSIAPAATADNQGAALVILKTQLEFIKQQTALTKCLKASPTRNTPCTTRNSLKLATMADRHIAQITAALDGTEAQCMRTVANQQIAYLRIWRDGARALHRNQRTKAKRIFLRSLKVQQALERTQQPCFLSVLGGG